MTYEMKLYLNDVFNDCSPLIGSHHTISVTNSNCVLFNIYSGNITLHTCYNVRQSNPSISNFQTGIYAYLIASVS